MFFGEYEYRVDEKGRIPIPPKFRQELRDGLVLTKGAEKCILVYPAGEWTQLAASLKSQEITPSNRRILTRAMFGGASDVTLDTQGRIPLPPSLREYAGIADTAVVTGANNYIEIWNKESWDVERSTAEAQAWQIIESLEARQ